ncbi:MAG: hypothetical protein ACLSEA_10155 [Thomasclavelia ramosa]
MSEREKVDTYTIPPNFAESGKWFSGRVSAGNVVEAAVMSLILLKILLQIPVEGERKSIWALSLFFQLLFLQLLVCKESV